jgi:4'-phosphopantetheinyl transferase
MVDVYQFRLGNSMSQLRAAEAVLSEDESLRFSRRASPWRERSIIARATLRLLLGQYLRVRPNDIFFEYGRFGKPCLTPSYAQNVSFSVSHSGDCAVIAISEGVPIGIDLEEIKDDLDVDLLSPYLFSPREIALFQKLPDDQRPATFFQAWTCKEAFVKATGEGISLSFSKFEVEFKVEKAARLLTLPLYWASFPWTLISLDTFSGFIGALAARSSEVIIQPHEPPSLWNG